MLLRSSSTPVLGSLLPPLSDGPNNTNYHHLSEQHGSTQKLAPNALHGKISCWPTSFRNQPGIHSPSPADTGGGFRRVRSEGNLDELAGATCNGEFAIYKKPAGKTSCRHLEAIPSFSLNQSISPFECDDVSDEGKDKEYQGGDSLNEVRIEGLNSEHVRNNVSWYCDLGVGGVGKMYLAAGLGVSGCNYVDFGGGVGGGGGGGGGSYKVVDFDRDGGGISMEEHYRRMMEENPGNALFMRNYAEFLYQEKRDLEGAEEYYSRAILADSQDGEILSQYAQLIWELYRDRERADNYFERAVQASSEDSHVHAAYASFLWDTEDEEDEEDEADSLASAYQLASRRLIASATA